MGTYSNSTAIAPPWSNKTVNVDNCLLEEVKQLWKAGVRTTGNCCGHNVAPAFISVWPAEIPKMLELGYETYAHPDAERKDHFIPKTIL